MTTITVIKGTWNWHKFSYAHRYFNYSKVVNLDYNNKHLKSVNGIPAVLYYFIFSFLTIGGKLRFLEFSSLKFKPRTSKALVYYLNIVIT